MTLFLTSFPISHQQRVLAILSPKYMLYPFTSPHCLHHTQSHYHVWLTLGNNLVYPYSCLSIIHVISDTMFLPCLNVLLIFLVKIPKESPYPTRPISSPALTASSAPFLLTHHISNTLDSFLFFKSPSFFLLLRPWYPLLTCHALYTTLLIFHNQCKYHLLKLLFPLIIFSK